MVKLVIRSNLKAIIKDLRIGVDFPAALDKKVEEIILKAVERAKANHRTTVLPRDL